MNATALDLAADSPLSYEQLAELNRARALGPRLAAMSPRERIGAAAVVAERVGRELCAVLDSFARLMEEAATGAASPAPSRAPAPRRHLVASETDPRLMYIVAENGSSCTCQSFRFRRDCKHARRAREAWQGRVRAVLAGARVEGRVVAQVAA